ncbi:hypothetical protein TNIN_73941 [Trichonephila inaurata madagascariensis]|uniref:Uncharacterized protein n=1 Tax=Trichonephila inaurata madagascariensis TaxID=2747483 RepID=A0A8X6Y8X4_9ARAC|nr:hypothetical protein TNIN_73941 [Trichonephila inaurata madagascariensis]
MSFCALNNEKGKQPAKNIGAVFFLFTLYKAHKPYKNHLGRQAGFLPYEDLINPPDRVEIMVRLFALLNEVFIQRTTKYFERKDSKRDERLLFVS